MHVQRTYGNVEMNTDTKFWTIIPTMCLDFYSSELQFGWMCWDVCIKWK